METYKEECEAKSVTINKLLIKIAGLEGVIRVKNKEIKVCIESKQESERQLDPVRRSLNLMTAAHGKLLRKVKRQGNKS
ncbi:MAG: hypothetical protein JKY50_00350 [Oleispira sp.]|nr:hypothetical protein [Oleispira sp.]